MSINKDAVKEMSKAILTACEHRNWNPYDLNQEQLKEIVTVVLGEPIKPMIAELKTLAKDLDVQLITPSADKLTDYQIGVDLAKPGSTDTTVTTRIVKGRDKH